jgi:pimeloyl-ACP methyl ester carboxylesterase
MARSDWPGDYSFELMPGDVLEALNQLGLSKVTLVGHSMGGTMAYMIAEQHPHLVERLTIEDPPPPFPRDQPIHGSRWGGPLQAAASYLDGSASYAADLIGPGGGCPDGTDGSLTGSPLIGAPATPPSGSVAPGPAVDTTCSASTAPAAPLPTSFTIENDSAVSVDLEWYDPSCQEVLYAQIPPQMQLTQKDYVGDVWHLRSQADGSLIGTVKAAATQDTMVVP